MTKYLRIKANTRQGYQLVQEGGVFDTAYPSSKNRRGRVQGDHGTVSPTLTAASSETILFIQSIQRICSQEESVCRPCLRPAK